VADFAQFIHRDLSLLPRYSPQLRPGWLRDRLQSAHGSRQTFERWLLEQHSQRQLYAASLAQSGHDLSREQRMTAQREEIIRDANAVAPEDVLPHSRHGDLLGVSRRHSRIA
jgi:hypothetical protein